MIKHAFAVVITFSKDSFWQLWALTLFTTSSQQFSSRHKYKTCLKRNEIGYSKSLQEIVHIKDCFPSKQVLIVKVSFIYLFSSFVLKVSHVPNRKQPMLFFHSTYFNSVFTSTVLNARGILVYKSQSIPAFMRLSSVSDRESDE